MPLEDVLDALVEHLTLGEYLRTREALCTRAPCAIDVRRTLCARMGLRRTYDMARLLRTAQRRCAECGSRTRARPRVCVRCASQCRGIYAMVDRHYLHAIGVPRAKWLALPRVRRAATGAFLYWKRDADALVASQHADALST